MTTMGKGLSVFNVASLVMLLSRIPRGIPAITIDVWPEGHTEVRYGQPEESP